MRFTSIMIVAAGLALAGECFAQSVTLHGPDGQSRTVTSAELAAMPHETAMLVNEHGPAKAYDGVPLTLMLQSVGAPAGKALHGPALADFVVISASDGYRVVLALAETDAGVRSEKILLADRSAGAPLAATEGPFRLVVEGDLRPTRSARMVTDISVQSAPAPK